MYAYVPCAVWDCSSRFPHITSNLRPRKASINRGWQKDGFDMNCRLRPTNFINTRVIRSNDSIQERLTLPMFSPAKCRLPAGSIILANPSAGITPEIRRLIKAKFRKIGNKVDIAPASMAKVPQTRFEAVTIANIQRPAQIRRLIKGRFMAKTFRLSEQFPSVYTKAPLPPDLKKRLARKRLRGNPVDTKPALTRITPDEWKQQGLGEYRSRQIRPHPTR